MKSFLKFENKGTITGKTSLWDVCSLDGCVIGRVKWYNSWRRYCFMPGEGTVFDAGCLREIAQFIEGEMAQRKTA